MHLGLDRVIGAWSRDGVIVDPGPSSTVETAARRASRAASRARSCSPTSTSTTPAPRARSSPDSPTCPSTSTRSARPTSSTPRGCCAAPAGSTAIGWTGSGARSLAVPEAQHHGTARRRAGRGPGGDRDPRPRLPSRRPTSTPTTATRSSATSAASGSRPSDTVWLPTPPPDIDVELWRASIATIAAREPARLLLTHFGSVEDPPRHLDAAAASSLRLAEQLPGRATARRSSPTSSAGSTRETRRARRADPLGDAAGADLARPRALLAASAAADSARPRLSAACRVRNLRGRQLRASVPESAEPVTLRSR